MPVANLQSCVIGSPLNFMNAVKGRIEEDAIFEVASKIKVVRYVQLSLFDCTYN